MMTTGQKIRYYREQIGMSQEALALASGYKGRSSISRIENDDGELKPSKIKTIAEVLGISPGLLVADTSITAQNATGSDEALVQFITKFDPDEIRILSSLSRKEVARIIGYAEKMIEDRKE